MSLIQDNIMPQSHTNRTHTFLFDHINLAESMFIFALAIYSMAELSLLHFDSPLQIDFEVYLVSVEIGFTELSK